ncbi:BZ3500_MvSof-1268-A1-R1_Chr1-3g02403 [Microbotryum saponariae]|uniref:BZ3500_MvSof-1268-A1-R1_Chr1-3g02403 protein n=1 Tax=Microbotryum saponariae TaxID=289078 RepID=A0A2X0MPE6_9BASI|nr:BZ3500_MvSof-1268-A1-R1_Chr1-3g02403 [Microbotryum saponariae]SCZ96190.1 BZ3501_MvSof-1269-A2-R1_Chr1-3g02006 [Microbotryum saponariae]
MTFSQPSTISHNPEARASSRLYLVAHEASLIRGHPDWARSVQVPSPSTSSLTTDARGRTRMMRWEAGSGPGFDDREGDVQQVIWIDRYDALNLLSSLPILEPTTTPLLPPDLGFEDLPDDAEEMFYFEPEEREAIERERRSKRLELGREERIKALKREEEEEEEEENEDEETEPSEIQLALMKKLHTTLSNAADPSLLEIRIMANHGRDPRFDFLRKEGKWSDVWERIKKGEPVGEEARRNAEENVGNGLGLGLNGYGSDSEEEEGDTAAAEEEDKLKDAANEASIPTPSTEEDKDEQERRAKKAEKIKEWARKRKEAREKEADKTQDAS